MKSAEYWRKRSEATARMQHVKADMYNASLAEEYDKAIMSVTEDIQAFYGKFAVNNQVSLADARKTLDKGELKEFKMTLEEFTAYAKDNADGRWTKTLNNVYYRTRISRLESILIQIRQQAEVLHMSAHTGLEGLMTDNYKEGYYRTLYELQRGTGVGLNFAKIDDGSVKNVLSADWAGSNYSERIWGDRDKLVREVQTQLTQAFIRGDSMDKTIRAVRDRFEVSRSNAARLVRTESAHISEEATFAAYRSSGVLKQYQFLAVLDLKTSSICREMDNRIFDLAEKETGINYPPLHVNCRSTTVPYFGDEDVGERIARGEDGKYYMIPDNMSYKQWYEKYVA